MGDTWFEGVFVTRYMYFYKQMMHNHMQVALNQSLIVTVTI